MRVIQDSDDEDQLEINLEADVQDPEQIGVPAAHVAKDSSHDTGSTESLQRAIQDTHRNHLQSEPSQLEPQSSVSLPEHPSIRLAVLQGVESGICQETLPSNIIACGPISYGVNRSPGQPWNLEGTIRDDYARHDPTTMFPEPSSTIPNATMTQQRILEVVAAPAMLGQEPQSDSLRYLPPPQASTPFSDVSKLSPRDSDDHLESFNTKIVEEGYKPPAEQRHGDSRTAPGGESLTPAPTSIHINYSARHDKAHKTPSEHDIEGIVKKRTPPSCTLSGEPPQHSQLPRSKKRQLIPELNSEDDEMTAVDLPEEQYKPRPSRSRSLKVDIDQSIDYSVRPENSRKTTKRRRTTGNLNDGSKQHTPEKIKQICAMGFSPSTTRKALHANNSDVTQSIDWLINNGHEEDELAPNFTPKKSVAKMEQQADRVDPEAIQMIMRDLNEYRRDEPTIILDTTDLNIGNESMSKADSTEDEPQQTTLPNEQILASIRSPSKVQVVIPSKSPRAEESQAAKVPTKKAKRTVSMPVHTEASSNGKSVTMPEAPTDKKRGRGRPKKVAKAVPSTSIAPIEEPEVIDEDLHGEPQKQREQQLQTIEAKKHADPSKDKSKQSCDAPLQEDFKPIGENRASTPMNNEDATRFPPEGSSKIKSRSPKNKDKVPHRVGLSKRARIAPLLRILKK
ncbi:hypothetical protein ACN47E_007603 [Coniothyrium glycines]